MTAGIDLFLFNLLVLWPLWQIFGRAGLPCAWALLVLVPGVGLFLALIVLGHSRWPNLPPRTPAPAVKARRAA